MFVFSKLHEKTYKNLLIIHMKKINRSKSHVHFHARNICEINSLLAHLNGLTMQSKFLTDRSQNVYQNIMFVVLVFFSHCISIKLQPVIIDIFSFTLV